MRKFYFITHSLLLTTTPSLLAYPQETPRIQIVSHKNLHKNFHKEKRYCRLTYDQILTLLDEIESDKARKKYKKEEIKQINSFLAYLANKGELPNTEHPLALQEDIRELLSDDDYEFAYALGDEEYEIIPAIYNDATDLEFYEIGLFSSPWKKTKKFIRNHKKEIIIGAIIIVVAAAVIVTIVAAPPAGAAVAAAASSVASSQLSTPQDPPELVQAPLFETELEQQATNFKEQLASESFFQPLSSVTEQLSMEETGRVLMPLLAQESINHLQSEISARPELAHEIQSLRSTYQVPIDSHQTYNIPPTHTNFQASSYYARGEKALSSRYYDQATHDFTKALALDPTNTLPYLERSMAYFHQEDYDRSLGDFQEYLSQTPASIAFSTAEFALGFAKGLPQGIFESGEGILVLLTDIMTNPLHTGQQIFESLSLLSQLAFSEEWGLLAEALAPEVRELVTQWNTLPSETRGELAGYAFGKYGADFFIPGAVGKAIAKGMKSTQELGTIYRGLKNAEKTLLLESVAGLESGAIAAEVVGASERTAYLAEELGITGREMGHLKQAGKLEIAITDTYEHLSPSMQESIAQHKKAQGFLKPHVKKPMPEEIVRAYIHEASIQTFPRPRNVPENFIVRITDRGAGMEYVHPTNTHLSVRVMPGKPHSPHPHQQKPYVVQMKDGKAFDKHGNLVSHESPEAHIPVEEFVFRQINVLSYECK